MNLAKFNAGDIPRRLRGPVFGGHQHPEPAGRYHQHTFSNERKAAQRIGRLLRLNPDETATVHLLMYQYTIDEQWMAQALAAYDPVKISYVDAISYDLPASITPFTNSAFCV